MLSKKGLEVLLAKTRRESLKNLNEGEGDGGRRAAMLGSGRGKHDPMLSEAFQTLGQTRYAKKAGRRKADKKNSDKGSMALFDVLKATQRLKIEKKVYEGFAFLVLIITFMLLVIELRKTSIAGETSNAMLDLFLKEEFTHVSQLGGEPFFLKNYGDIKTQEEWWLWAFGPLLKGLFNEEVSGSVAGQHEKFSGIGLPMNTSQVYVLGGDQGGVLLRTARVDPVPCTPALLGISSPCYPSWNDGPVSVDAFGTGKSEAFRYRTSGLDSEVEGTLLGNLYFAGNYYGKSGFFVDVPANNAGNRSVQTLVDLFEGQWLDKASRVVSVEFNLYNPESKVVLACQIFTEMAQTAGVRPSYRFYHVNALMWSIGGGYYFCAAVFLVLLLFFSFSWIRKMLFTSQIAHFFKRWDVVFDLVLWVLLWACVIQISVLTAQSRVIRESTFAETLERNTFTPGIFEEARSLHNFDALCSINLILATVKLIGYMPFQTTRTIWATLAGVVKDILVLGSVVLLFWCGFAVGSHLTFGSLGFADFERVDKTFGTLMVLMFSGSIDYNAMRNVSFVSAPIFYGVYMIFMWGVMLNLFVAIIVLAYERFSDARSNFDKWSASHYEMDHGCIIMSVSERMYHSMRQAWFGLRSHMYARTAEKVSVGGSSRALNIGGSTRALNIGESDVNHQVDGESFPGGAASGMEIVALHLKLEKIREQMQLVIKAGPKGSPERAQKAEELNYPFNRLLWEHMRRINRQIGVYETREIVKEYTDEDDGSFVCKWRAEFNQMKGPEGTVSIFDYLFSYFHCCRCYFMQQDGSAQEVELAETGQRSSLFHGQKPCFRNSALHGSGFLDAEQTKAQVMEKNRIRKKAFLDNLLEREKKLAALKKENQKILRETQHLFKMHRLSFTRLLERAWRNTDEEMRVQELSYDDLKELMSPGCVERKRKCKICDKAKIEASVEKLLRNYAELKKSSKEARKVMKKGFYRRQNGKAQ